MNDERPAPFADDSAFLERLLRWQDVALPPQEQAAFEPVRQMVEKLREHSFGRAGCPQPAASHVVRRRVEDNVPYL